MVQTKFERQKIGQVLELLKHTVVGVWAEITLSQDRLNVWPESGNILDLDIFSNIKSTVNGDEDGVGSIHIATHSNVLGDILGDGDDLVPAPLQNTTISTDKFEVIYDVLNTNTKAIDDENSEINELQGITSAIGNPQINDESGDESIPDHIMTQN